MAYEDLPKEETMPAIFHDWLADLDDIEERSEKTVKAYSQALRRVLHFAKLPPEKLVDPSNLSQAVLTDAVREMRRAARRVSKSTLNQTLAGVVSFFDWCVVTKDSEGRSMLQGDPPDIRRIRKISKLESPRSDPEYYLPADIEKLFASAGAESDSEIRWPVRDLAMCAFLAVLGLRASELTDLRVNSVTQERLSTSDKSATWMLQVLGKGKKWRSLPLSDELHRAVTQWEKARKVEIKSLQVKFRNLNLAEGVVDWLVDTKGFPTSVSVGAVRSALGEGDMTSPEYVKRVKRRAQEEANKTMLMGKPPPEGHLLEGSVKTLGDEANEHADRAERLALEPDAPLFVPNAGWKKVITVDEKGKMKEELHGFTYRQLRYWMLLLNKGAKLRERTPHALRHTAGVQLAVDGVPMNVIQGLLGHASVATTGIYTELAAGELVGALDRTEANSLLGEALKRVR